MTNQTQVQRLCGDCKPYGSAAVRLCDKHASVPDLLAALEEISSEYRDVG
jgi:hypothetical protein